MTTEQKIIRAKVGLLELAKQLGNVSQACKMMGYIALAVEQPGFGQVRIANEMRKRGSHRLARRRALCVATPRSRGDEEAAQGAGGQVRPGVPGVDRCNTDDEGEDDPSLITLDNKTRPLTGIECQIELRLIHNMHRLVQLERIASASV
jgi:hypothetical protein